MAESLQALQLLEFKDLTKKSDGYGKALKNEYEDYDFGFSVGFSVMVAIFFSFLGIITVGSLVIDGWPVLVAGICSAVAGFCSFFIPYNYLRRRGVRRFLADPEAQYLYKLKQAVCAYNENSSLYNQHLLALENGDGQIAPCELQAFRDALEKERQDLQKRIVSRSFGKLSPISLYKVLDRTRELREAETQLVLPAPQNEAAVPKQLTQMSAEYQESLAELDAEFPDKD